MRAAQIIAFFVIMTALTWAANTFVRPWWSDTVDAMPPVLVLELIALGLAAFIWSIWHEWRGNLVSRLGYDPGFAVGIRYTLQRHRANWMRVLVSPVLAPIAKFAKVRSQGENEAVAFVAACWAFLLAAVAWSFLVLAPVAVAVLGVAALLLR